MIVFLMIFTAFNLLLWLHYKSNISLHKMFTGFDNGATLFQFIIFDIKYLIPIHGWCQMLNSREVTSTIINRNVKRSCLDLIKEYMGLIFLPCRDLGELPSVKHYYIVTAYLTSRHLGYLENRIHCFSEFSFEDPSDRLYRLLWYMKFNYSDLCWFDLQTRFEAVSMLITNELPACE